MPAEPHKPFRVISHISWTAEPISEILGILERADPKLQGDKIWRKSVILGSTPPPWALIKFVWSSMLMME